MRALQRLDCKDTNYFSKSQQFKYFSLLIDNYYVPLQQNLTIMKTKLTYL